MFEVTYVQNSGSVYSEKNVSKVFDSYIKAKCYYDDLFVVYKYLNPFIDENYKFVGNTNKDIDFLKDLDFKTLDNSCDINGNFLNIKEYVALFINKKDLKKYEQIMRNK